MITDQYLQTAVHTPEEERQFTELALRLLDETEIPTRAAGRTATVGSTRIVLIGPSSCARPEYVPI